MDIAGDSLSAQLLGVLETRGSATLDDLALALRVRPAAIRQEARRLQAQGLIIQQGLGAETYVTRTGAPYRILGASSTRRAQAKRTRPAATPPRDDDDPAFG